MAQVTKDTMIGELLRIDQNVAPILLEIGMHLSLIHISANPHKSVRKG